MKLDGSYYRYYRIIDVYNKTFNFIISARKSGKVIHFERVHDKDGTYTYKNIKIEDNKYEKIRKR